MEVGPSELSLLFLLGTIPVTAFIVYLTSRVTKKAGYSGWWSLIMLVPLANVVAMWVFAFSDWPNLEGEYEDFEDV